MIGQFDHIAITVTNIEETQKFYDGLFGVSAFHDHAPDGILLVRQLKIGDALISVHQFGNGMDLVARTPTRGSADICFRWKGTIDSAITVLRNNGIAIVEGPAPRLNSAKEPSQSIYFRDPDGNLIELMAPSG